ncbi:MAG TPA: peroxidase family protein, partial [Ilumatobacteraceae bacterium]|nr:peroxidase family protein [Ilumatobacteraceae bacterium]
MDGSCNNLVPGQETFGAADQTFPRLTTPVYRNAEPITAALPVGPPGPTSYAQTSGSVIDSEPRTISNLIVDQTSTNPAAIAAAGYPVRTQGDIGVVPCTIDPTPADPNGTPNDCVPSNQTLFIPNVTTDFGLSPPYNSLFTIFGQFFDHGIDKITNGGTGTVFVPLKADDPLVVAGPDGKPSTGDEVPPSQAFMVLTRGTTITDANGQRNSPNTDTPYVDQSQTYTSHSSHQIFLREYDNTSTGVPLATGKFLSSEDGGMANWAMIKEQAATKLGLQLVDLDVNNIPMLAADPYGNFIPGPNGLPQYVTASGLVEGNLATPVPVPADARHIDTAFLNDIAHSATPTNTPDADDVAGGSLDPVAPGEYDNELLDLHFICGDGRCNENIALSAIHQVFHSEHDRMIDDIQNTLNHNPELLAAYADVSPTTFEYGERLFQAARFVTEMEYQHLVFEEFARKVQPAINPFQPFALIQTDTNAAITAEFAHAVYRFGHSMLDEDIPRTNENGSKNDIALLDGFLNPAAYYDGGSVGHLTSRQAAGSIVMGLSDQVGNELDEFVTNTLRNNLLGLPLDLAAINMTRARSEGIPSLNNVRKQLFAQTNDGQLTPYANWIDFGLALKHPESLVNFVAAYGKHPTILAQSTVLGKREAARLIVDPGTGDVQPADALDFIGSTGAWANSATGVSKTGLDDVDLWVGGLAENTNPFGGLLGTTFNYVFENQLTNLQNGDRFYYLARTPGMNLRTQLEGNSFAELIMRNTTAHSLKADSFATADCKFELGSNPGIAGPITGTSIVDDPKSECNENALLIRMPGGQIRYRPTNSIDPPGVNGQSVFNGTDGADKVYGGNDNDTFLGNEGNDVIEGGAGDDVALGGIGNDIITDLGGFDTLKGGPDNDALDGGIDDDILMGGDGSDFTNGGANNNIHFLGAGNDFAIGGQGQDEVIGGAGDDWEEGGDMPDLLIGDSSTFFFDDHDLPGNDVFIGQSGDDDYDYEGGDDIGVAGPGIEKNAGAAGYDWLIGQGDPQPLYQDLDLNLTGVDGGQPAIEARDRFNEVEALSGWNLNDQLFGDDVVPATVGG